MDFKDYYAALGVAPEADEAAIKAAYRKLARQFHPDVNPGDTQAEDRFKAINEAYQVLGDGEQRRKYDAMRDQYQRGGASNFDYGQWQSATGGSYSVNADDLNDMFGGDSPYSDFFSSIFGGAGPARESRPRRGRDLEVAAEVTLEEAFHGTTRSIQIGERTIELRIAPGVRTGSRIRFAGQGSPGAAGGAAGDLFLIVEVLADERYERDGDDLVTQVPVDFITAATGGEARVATLDGSVKLRIPPRTQADTRFRLRGKGMPKLGRAAQHGDMYAQARIVLPDDLNDNELETLRTLKRAA